MFKHAVLVYAGFMRKGIGADDGFIRLHRVAGDGGDQFTGGHDLRGIDAGLKVEHIATRAQCHHHFFQTGVAGAFA